MNETKRNKLIDVCYKYTLRDVAFRDVVEADNLIKMGGTLAQMAADRLFNVKSPVAYKYARDIKQVSPLKLAFTKIASAVKGEVIPKNKWEYSQALNKRAVIHIDQFNSLSNIEKREEFKDFLIGSCSHIEDFNLNLEAEYKRSEAMSSERLHGFAIFKDLINQDPVTKQGDECKDWRFLKGFANKDYPGAEEWEEIYGEVVSRVVRVSIDDATRGNSHIARAGFKLV